MHVPAVGTPAQAPPVRVPLPDAVAARAKMVSELKVELKEAKSEETESTRSVVTVGDYAELWTKRRVARLKRSVQEHCLGVLAERVLPRRGKIPIRDMTRARVEEWVGWTERQRTEKDGKPYAQDTLRTWYRVLKTVLKDAAAEYSLADPTFRVMPPRSRVVDVRVKETFTIEQLGLLVETARERFPEWYAPIYVLAYTGMRAGELCAFRWSDIDAKKGCIHVRRSAWKDEESTTKSGTARDVALPEAMQSVVLTEWRKELMREQGPRVTSGLVFLSMTGKHLFSSALHKAVATCSDVAELPFRASPQVLRRTFHTLLVETGVSQVVLRSQMGHTSTAMTQRYVGIHIERKQEAVSSLILMTERSA